MMELHVCNREGAVLKAFALGDTSEIIVGRDASCDIQIKAKTVSREHCSIESEGDELVLRDLESSCGTFLDGRKIDSIRIEDGMEINVGPAILKFYDSGI